MTDKIKKMMSDFLYKETGGAMGVIWHPVTESDKLTADDMLQCYMAWRRQCTDDTFDAFMKHRFSCDPYVEERTFDIISKCTNYFVDHADTDMVIAFSHYIDTHTELKEYECLLQLAGFKGVVTDWHEFLSEYEVSLICRGPGEPDDAIAWSIGTSAAITDKNTDKKEVLLTSEHALGVLARTQPDDRLASMITEAEAAGHGKLTVLLKLNENNIEKFFTKLASDDNILTIGQDTPVGIFDEMTGAHGPFKIRVKDGTGLPVPIIDHIIFETSVSHGHKVSDVLPEMEWGEWS